MTIADVLSDARRIECEEDGLYFARYFFKQRFGGKMLISPHHKVIQSTLDRVISGEITRLVINIPPGYTKTELASINFMARGLALNAKARFLHLSYSHHLALLNSSTSRAIMRSQVFQDMWPMQTKDDTDSKNIWYTEAGGGVVATSAAGQVTGFRAGHMEPGFTGALIIDDPVKPDDAFSEVMRDGVNERFNETIKSRLAVESVPIVVIMQRIHYSDLSGYLLRGGSGEMWHHLSLPVYVDGEEYADKKNTHAIPIPHGLDNGWLWPIKHNDKHMAALKSHKRSYWAQYMQRPRQFDEEFALWTEKMIAEARAMDWPWKKYRTIVAVDPAVSNEDDSDDTGIVVASAYTDERYSVDADYTLNSTTDAWADEVIRAYESHDADAVVVEVNNGGDLVENVLRLKKFKGRVIAVRASKGKFARAEPVSALYEQHKVKHDVDLLELETEIMEYVPKDSKKSPNRLDALVWAITELAGIGSGEEAGGFSW